MVDSLGFDVCWCFDFLFEIILEEDEVGLSKNEDCDDECLLLMEMATKEDEDVGGYMAMA